MRILLASLILVGFLTSPALSLADMAEGQKRGVEEVRLYFFWAPNCPYCAQEKAFLEELGRRVEGLEVLSHDVWEERKNLELLEKLAAAYGEKGLGTPATFVGPRAWIGFTPAIARQIEEAVLRCRSEGCPEPLDILKGRGFLPPEDAPMVLPLFGELNPRDVSLPLLTLGLGLLDSFNPCAFFVLLFLLSLLVHARSRRRMAVVGGTFVFFSGLLYFLFMAAWLNLFLLAGEREAITLAAGLVAVGVGALNIKDFLLFRQGVSLSIPEEAKPRLFARMRQLIHAGRMPGLLAGTAALALFANTYELLCTAGFPMIYTRILTLHQLDGAAYYGWIALYNLVYILPLLAIVLVFTFTLGSRKLTEWQGRVLKLVSGTMMLALGAVLLVDPTILQDAMFSFLLLAGAVGGAGVVAVLYRKHGR